MCSLWIKAEFSGGAVYVKWTVKWLNFFRSPWVEIRWYSGSPQTMVATVLWWDIELSVVDFKHIYQRMQRWQNGKLRIPRIPTDKMLRLFLSCISLERIKAKGTVGGSDAAALALASGFLNHFLGSIMNLFCPCEISMRPGFGGKPGELKLFMVIGLNIWKLIVQFRKVIKQYGKSDPSH